MIRLNGARGIGLLGGGIYALTRGVAYLSPFKPEDAPAGIMFLTQWWGTIDFWAALWIVVAIICFVCAFRRHDALGWGLLTGIMTAWGLAYLGGWLYSVVPGPPPPSREWLTAFTYLGPAFIISALSAQVRGRRAE